MSSNEPSRFTYDSNNTTIPFTQSSMDSMEYHNVIPPQPNLLSPQIPDYTYYSEPFSTDNEGGAQFHHAEPIGVPQGDCATSEQKHLKKGRPATYFVDEEEDSDEEAADDTSIRNMNIARSTNDSRKGKIPRSKLQRKRNTEAVRTCREVRKKNCTIIIDTLCTIYNMQRGDPHMDHRIKNCFTECVVSALEREVKRETKNGKHIGMDRSMADDMPHPSTKEWQNRNGGPITRSRGNQCI